MYDTTMYSSRRLRAAKGRGGEGQVVLELFESLFGTVIVCYGSMDLCFWINLLLYYL